MNATRDEQWRPIPGSNGRYDVSDQGRVRANRWTVHTANGQVRTYQTRMMSTYTEERTGYSMLRLSAPNGTRLRRVHNLVAEAFLGPRPEGADVCHNDSDGTNNRLSNLRYDTHVGNFQDMVDAGRSTYGENQPNAVLTEEMVLYARRRYVRRSRTDGIPAMAREFGVNEGTLKAAVIGPNWKYLNS